MTNTNIPPFGVWLKNVLVQAGKISPDQQYIDMDPKERDTYLKIFEKSIQPSGGADRPFKTGLVTNSDDPTLVYEADFYRDGTYQIREPRVQNFRDGSAEVIAPGKTRYLTNIETMKREQNYQSSPMGAFFGGQMGNTPISQYSAQQPPATAAPQPAAPAPQQAAQQPVAPNTSVNQVAPPTVAPPPQASVQGMVRVMAPNGQTGTIPADQLEQALREGYRQIQ